MTEQQRMVALRMAASIVHRLARHESDVAVLVADIQGLLEAIGLRQLDSNENCVVAARRAAGETE